MATRADFGTKKAGGIEEIIPKLGAIKAERSKLEKLEKPLVSELKGLMLAAKKDKVSAGGYVATVTPQQKDSMDEAMAIEILKDELSAQPELLQQFIKTVEVLDTDALEAAVFQHKVDGAMLAPAIVHGETTYVLKCTAEKKKKK